MNRLKSAALVLLAVVVATSLVFIPQQNASAQGSAALSIVPKKTYTIEPGKTVNDTLLIRNQDRERPLNLSLRVIDFSYMDDSGAPKLMLAEDAPQTAWSLRKNISIPETVSIEPGASESIDMSVTIPENQGGCSLYSAIVYSSTSSEGGNVGLSASGVTLVFANIPCECKEDLQLKKVGAYKETGAQSGGEYAYFHLEKPKRMAYTLKNSGNVAESPVGSITLKPWFGKETVINNINPNGSLALIGQERTFTACVKLKGQDVNFDGTRAEATTCDEPVLWPGFYTMDLAGYYGQNGNNTKDIVGSSWFVYMPWWAIIVLVLALAFIGFYIWKLVRHIRSKNSKTKLKKRK